MRYGCIGEHLTHSFSKEIHNALSDYEYELCEVEREVLEDFLKVADFLAINVTIPYKEAVIPSLYSIDEFAKSIGAVNTVVNRDGRLYGYNTDFYGMSMLIAHAGIEISDKKVAILGTGGTSKTADAVVKSLGARSVIKVTRTPNNDAISYAELKEKHLDTDIIINTTPVGMFPNISDTPLDISDFSMLSGVIDAIYNPQCTSLILSAKERGILAEGGLYMLVAQAVRASEIFLDKEYPKGTLEKVYEKILSEKKNIVLIGMPASGKSTVGKLLSDLTGKILVDTDELIEKQAGLPIKEIFEKYGEKHFRELEQNVIEEVSKRSSLIIATGGGAILQSENVGNLRKNGKLYFIDRPLGALIPTEDRPLSSTKEAITSRYNERYGIYCKSADVIIDADCDALAVSEKIEKDFFNHENIRYKRP